MILRCIHPKLPLWGKSRSGWGLGLGGCFFHPLTRRHTRYLFEGGEEVGAGGKSGLLPHAVDGEPGVAFFVHQFLGVFNPEFVFQIGKTFIQNHLQAILHMMTGCIQLGTQVVYGEDGIQIRFFVRHIIHYPVGEFRVDIIDDNGPEVFCRTAFRGFIHLSADGFQFNFYCLITASGVEYGRVEQQIHRNTQVNNDGIIEQDHSFDPGNAHIDLKKVLDV